VNCQTGHCGHVGFTGGDEEILCSSNLRQGRVVTGTEVEHPVMPCPIGRVRHHASLVICLIQHPELAPKYIERWFGRPETRIFIPAPGV
jgi:hypothetical protein